jgi:hypothetical protein
MSLLEPPNLPKLDSSPFRHPHCCFTLSTSGIETIVRILANANSLVLSIGSGSGLLEALVAQRDPNLNIQGVEVNESINKYLPDEEMNIVKATWDMCEKAATATAWIFAYPRSPDLVKKYLECYGQIPNLRVILWIGPIDDWSSFERIFKEYELEMSKIDTPMKGSEFMIAARPPARSPARSST